MPADKKERKEGYEAMAYQSTVIDGIVIGARNIAWIESTRIKVIHVVNDWDSRTIDLPTVADRFGTTKIELVYRYLCGFTSDVIGLAETRSLR